MIFFYILLYILKNDKRNWRRTEGSKWNFGGILKYKIYVKKWKIQQLYLATAKVLSYNGLQLV